MKYSIDTSALINAYRIAYPRDVFPAVWDCIDRLVREGLLGASEVVRDELEEKDDELAKWARGMPGMFRPTDDAIQREVYSILSTHSGLVKERSDRQDADPFVIALARVEGCFVVASEKPSWNPLRPKIPDVCRDLDVPYLSLVAMFREEHQTF